MTLNRKTLLPVAKTLTSICMTTLPWPLCLAGHAPSLLSPLPRRLLSSAEGGVAGGEGPPRELRSVFPGLPRVCRGYTCY